MINEDDTDWVIDEIVKEKDFEKSNTGIETGDLTEELKNPQDFQDGDEIIPDDLNEGGFFDPRTQALFKRSRHKNLSFWPSVENTMNYQNELFELMETSTTSSNKTSIAMFKIFIKIKQAWVWRLNKIFSWLLFFGMKNIIFLHLISQEIKIQDVIHYD